MDLSLLPRGFFSFSERREEVRTALRHYPPVSVSHCTVSAHTGRGKHHPLHPFPIPSPASQTSQHTPLGSRFGYHTPCLCYCSGASGVAADGPCSSLGLGWAGHPRTASASQVLGASMQPGKDSTKWKLSLGKAWQHLRSCLPLAEELLLVFISFLQRSMTRSLSKPSQPKDRSR